MVFKEKQEQPDYLVGSVDFLGSKIDLSQKPFIPRSETEFWVEKSLDKLQDIKKDKIYCLDLFSGSGCIGISVLKKIKNSCCDFGEVDKNFLKQIEINLAGNKISGERRKIIKTNIFSGVKKKYDCIFANPPYVAENRIDEVEESVKMYEPNKALFAGEDGMFFIRKFLKEFENYLNDEGMVFMEFDPDQKKEIEDLLKAKKGIKFEFWEDQFKKFRTVFIKKQAQN
ncbi:MAG: HemK family protein methyltransferase [bacterium]|nr:HemK family protein methyltransferase [bacterium]